MDNTRAFKMEVIRKTALTSYAAARDVGDDNAARSATIGETGRGRRSSSDDPCRSFVRRCEAASE